MKRGKDDEKITGPMFPRLHVNDTEKGGPRAPPRNKMALYEQLSIPSQRFNTGSLPDNPNNNSNSVPPASSSQGNGHERGLYFPLLLFPSLHPSEKPYTRYTDLKPSLVQVEPKNRQEEDDFTVPIFDQSNMGSDRLPFFSSAYSGRSVNFRSSSEKDPKQTDSTGINLRQEGSRQSEGNSKDVVSGREKLNNSALNQSSRGKVEGPLRQVNASSSFENNNHPVSYMLRINNTIDSSQHEYQEESRPVRGLNYRNSSVAMGDFQQEEQRSPTNPTNDAESHEDTCRSLQTGILDRGDDVSETSMVDSISGVDLSPNDVVGIIGQKHFWKARRAIVNQQRVFAVQVFELHRLIKVQKLIAESPHILLEDSAYLGIPLKDSPAKKLPLDYIVKATPTIVKRKDVPEKPIHRAESSAENAVARTPPSSLQNSSQPSNYGPFSGNPPPTYVNNDQKMGSWGFNQPASHQWLIPVMTPSEGLVYKPYQGPGFMNSIYGGPGSTPLMGNFQNYGFSVPHHYQGLGAATFASAGCHGYFPPYGMPVMHPSFSVSGEQMDHLNMQNQASCNIPSQRNATVSDDVKLNPRKDCEIQVSTASSASDRGERTRAGNSNEGRNALSLFPTSPVVHVLDGALDRPTQVIKVVPHNARSATESVARIFQSIQEERKQYDSV